MGFYTFLTQTQQLAGGTVPGALTVGGTLATSGLFNINAGGGINAALGNIDVQTAGNGYRTKEGANAKQGTFTLSGAATTVVANTSVTASSRIFMQTATLGTVTAASTLAYTVSAGTSFTVTPSQSTDTSTINFEIFEPG